MSGEALKRFESTSIGIYKAFGDPSAPEQFAMKLKRNSDLVISFAKPDNKDFDGIVNGLKRGKMLVDWLNEWRKCELKNDGAK